MQLPLMDINAYIHLLRRHWIVIASLTVVGVLLALVITGLTTKQYSSSTKLFVSVQSLDSNSTIDAFQGGSAAQQRARSYVDVATSARVLDPVLHRLNLDMSAKALASKVRAASPTGSVLVEVTVTDESPESAAQIANAIGGSFRSVVADDLEVPPGGGESLVKVETIEPATVPTQPTSPNTMLNAMLGLFAGLLAGLCGGALRSAADIRIRSIRDVEGTTSTPVLGGIGFDTDAEQKPLVVLSGPRSPLAEAFRSLRTNLQFVGIGSDRRVFVTTSAVPREGKSTTTANLAVAIAESGRSVALVDGDLRRPRMAEIMSVEGAVGLTNVLIGEAELDDVLQPWGKNDLVVLAAGALPPNPSELLGSAAMRAVIDELAVRFDYVLIDAPPILPVTDAALLTSMSSGALVVVAANRSTRPQMRAALDNLTRASAPVVGTIVTMLPTKGSGSYGYRAYSGYYGPVEPAEGPPA